MEHAPHPAIQIEDAGSRGRYVMAFPGGLEAEMTFRRAGAIMTIDHTGVPPALENRGIAAALLARVVADARALNFKIAPACSYVAAQFRRREDWADLLA
jgi:hypothetical protein